VFNNTFFTASCYGNKYTSPQLSFYRYRLPLGEEVDIVYHWARKIIIAIQWPLC